MKFALALGLALSLTLEPCPLGTYSTFGLRDSFLGKGKIPFNLIKKQVSAPPIFPEATLGGEKDWFPDE